MRRSHSIRAIATTRTARRPVAPALPLLLAAVAAMTSPTAAFGLPGTALAADDPRPSILAAPARSTGSPGPGVPNPGFLNESTLLRSGRLDVGSGPGGRRLGVTTPPLPVDYTTVRPRLPQPRALPATFDLRAAGRLTRVKDQGTHGTCWAFATTSSLESSFLPGASWDFSEDNVSRQVGYDGDPYDRQPGGDAYMAAAYFARGVGPVTEADDAYGDAFTPAGLAARARLRDWHILTAGDAVRSPAAIKNALMTYGPVVTSIHWSAAYYRAATRSFHDPSPTTAGHPTNHLVTIVGWNDGYSRTSFATPAAIDGAWIARNSWGTGWGDGGYFYISYDDCWAGGWASTFVGQGVAAYRDVYQHDPFGSTNAWGWGGSDPADDRAAMANDFTATSAGQVHAAGFYTVGANTSYAVYTSRTHDDYSSTLQTWGTMTYAGYHQVSLPYPVTVSPGDRFSITVWLFSPGCGGRPIPVEQRFAGYCSGVTSRAGESFICRNGTWTWYDVGAPGNTTPVNVSLKAFTKPATADPTPPATTVTGASNGWTRTPVTLTFSAADNAGGWGVAFTEARLDGGAYRQTRQMTVSAEGTHTVTYRSQDNAGNTEAARAATVRIDKTGPRTRALRQLTVKRNRRVVFPFRVDDLTPKATVVIKVFKGRKLKKKLTVGAVACNCGRSYTWRRCALARGTYTWKVYATDEAGNAQRVMVSRKLVVR